MIATFMAMGFTMQHEPPQNKSTPPPKHARSPQRLRYAIQR